MDVAENSHNALTVTVLCWEESPNTALQRFSGSRPLSGTQYCLQTLNIFKGRCFIRLDDFEEHAAQGRKSFILKRV